MSLIIKGNTPATITYNGQPVDYVYYNGQLVWPESIPFTYTYTGTCTESDITYGGVNYKLLTLTTDGTLTLSKSVHADIWACGGGSRGLQSTDIDSSYNGAGPGGAGAYCAELDNQLIDSLNVVIGPANAASGTIISGDVSLTALGVHNSRDGGTGGGGSTVLINLDDTPVRTRAGRGDGVSKYPFGDTTNFDPHCAGGAGGNCRKAGPTTTAFKGGDGGSNGSNGSAGASTKSVDTSATGGNRGGGDGGVVPSNGHFATYYGAGGGGAGKTTSAGAVTYLGGAGYQGVCYIRIPLSEF